MIPRLRKYPAPIAREASDNYSQVRNPATGNTYYGGRHNANDLKPTVAGRFGEPVYAEYERGTVVGVRTWKQTGLWGRAFGNRIKVRWRYSHEHKNGTRHTHSWWTFHAHLATITVREGDTVGTETTKKKLGTVGGSGQGGLKVFPPHVHWQLHTKDTYLGTIDPHERLEAQRQRELDA